MAVGRREAGGSNRDVGGSDRSVGGRDLGVGGRVVFQRRFDVSIADDGWDEANGDRTDRAMEQRAAANLERSAPAAVGDLESGFRVFESSTWRPTGLTSSPWADKEVYTEDGSAHGGEEKGHKKRAQPERKAADGTPRWD